MALTKIGIIGDVHCENTHLEAILNFFKSQALDDILCTGDLADGIGNLGHVIELLQAHNVKTVRGNHDRWLLNNEMRQLENSTTLANVSAEQLSILKNLPKTIEVFTVAGSLMLCHGIMENDMNKINPDDFGYSIETNEDLKTLLSTKIDFVVNGHSHRRMLRKFANCTIINAGTLDRRHEPCCGIADFAKKHVQFYSLKSDNKLEIVESIPFP